MLLLFSFCKLFYIMVILPDVCLMVSVIFVYFGHSNNEESIRYCSSIDLKRNGNDDIFTSSFFGSWVPKLILFGCMVNIDSMLYVYILCI